MVIHFMKKREKETMKRRGKKNKKEKKSSAIPQSQLCEFQHVFAEFQFEIAEYGSLDSTH
jgi:hypothetical protein